MLKKTVKSAILLFFIGGIGILMACSNTTKTAVLRLSSDPLRNAPTHSELLSIKWDDGAFTKSAFEFNPMLAKECAALSSAAFSSDALLSDLSELGFSKNAKFAYSNDSDESKVGVVISSKKIEDFTLVAIVFRGTVKNEWYTNFDIGYSTDHLGFMNASKYAVGKIEKYLSNYYLENEKLKFLVSGYSRGGAVANLTAKYLIDNYSPDDVYAYTYATPNTTRSNATSYQKYSGIFNFVCDDDIITKLPIESLGYSKYGTTINLADKSDENYSKMLLNAEKSYQELTGEELKIADNKDRVDDFLNYCYELVPTVEDYYAKKFSVGDEEITMYKYMLLVANMLNDSKEADANMLLYSLSSDFAPLTEFLIDGINLENLGSGGDIVSDADIVACHKSERYVAFVDAYVSLYDSEEFTSSNE